jgi:hypothetical protein
VPGDFSLFLPEGVVNEIAERAAQLVAERANGSPWMTRRQAAGYLSLPVSRLEKDRSIPCHRDEGRVLYHRDELDAHFLAKGPAPGTSWTGRLFARQHRQRL